MPKPRFVCPKLLDSAKIGEVLLAKKTFKNMELALEACKGKQNRPTPYQCGYCGYWHLTNKSC